MNYGELKQEILDIAKLTLADTVGARVAAFVRRAEGMIAQHVRALEMYQQITLTETERISSSRYALPAGTLDVILSTDSNGVPLTRRGTQEFAMFSDADPVHSYRIQSDPAELSITFRGNPGTDAVFSVITCARPAAMVSATHTNALLTAHESLYIHGALHWLYLDAHDSDLAAAHLNGFMSDAERISAVAKRALRSPSINALQFGLEGSAM